MSSASPNKILLFDRSLRDDRDFWLRQFADVSHRGVFQHEALRPGDGADPFWTTTVSLPDPVWQRMTKLTGGRPFLAHATLLAAIKLCLYKYGGGPTILVGCPGSPTEGSTNAEPNALAVQSKLQAQMSFKNLLADVRSALLAAYEHQRYPFERLLRDLNLHTITDHCPLFEILLAHRELHPDVPNLGQDLTILMSPSPTGLLLEFSGRKTTFSRESLNRFAEHCQNAVAAGLQDPTLPISQLRVNSEEERQQLLVNWNATSTMTTPVGFVHELVADFAERTPNAIAVVHEDRSLTYGELNAQANKVAQHLIDVGLGPDVLVGLLLDRSPDLVIAALAVLKAGGAYVPLDPNSPPQRIQSLLSDAQISVLLTRGSFLPELQLPNHVHVVQLEAIPPARSDTSARPLPRILPANLAYVIYTSGSTGKPKGVQVPHAGLSNLVQWHQRTYEVTPDDRASLVAETIFDASIWEMWPYLTAGASIHIPDDETRKSPTALARWISDQKLTLCFAPTSLAEALLRERWPDECSLRTLLTGGDALHRVTLHAIPFSLANHYGLTECSVVTTSGVIDESETGTPPIGRPIADTDVYILDRDLNPAPLGALGELYIGGKSIARGYRGRPDLTAERFVPHPFQDRDGDRLYRTGDLVRYRADGQIEFQKRSDEQVQLQGIRVEPGEVEATLLECPGVQQAVVVARADATGRLQLAGYATLEDGMNAADAPDLLRRALHERLPNYMVPRWLVVLDSFPTLENGKIHRQGLCSPESAQRANRFVAPRNDVEKQLANIWSDVLKVERVGIHDNFFELGGDSILSIQVVARARKCQLQFTPREMFQHQRIAELALIAQQRGPLLTAQQTQVTGPVPLTPIQRWFFDEAWPHPHHFNQTLLFEVQRPVELGFLRNSILKLMVHHDALRARFIQTDNGWQQRLDPVTPDEVDAIVSCLDLTGLPDSVQTSIQTAAAAQLQTSLNLSTGPLLRVALFRRQDVKDRLMLAVHHLVVDGVSWRILLEDLLTAYQQLENEQLPDLLPKTTSWQHWAERLMAFSSTPAMHEELPYWRSLLDQDSGRLPVDFPEGENTIASRDVVTVTLDEEETRALLHDVPIPYRTQINDVLLTALAQAFAAWTGTTNLLLDLEGHGREDLFEDIDLSRTVGWFTTMFPVRLHSNRKAELGDLLKSIKEQLRTVPSNGIGYGLLRYGDNQNLLAGLRTPEVSFNYLGQFDSVLPTAAPLSLAPESTGPARDQHGQRAHLIEIDGGVGGGRLRLMWSYSCHVHRRETMTQLAENFVTSLRQLITHCRTAKPSFSPSDFPLAALSQSEFDLLAEQQRDIEDLYPLSPLQQGLLYHALYAPGSDEHVVQITCKLTQQIDNERFQQVWQTLLEQHDVLRSSFVWEGLSRPVQIVRQHAALTWDARDWRSLPETEQQRRLAALVTSEREQGFDLEHPPAMRAVLVRLTDESAAFIWTYHHILLDGWSVAILLKKLMIIYESGLPMTALLPATRAYRDYISWIRNQDLSAAEAFWKEKLQGWQNPTPLPAIATVKAPTAAETDYDRLSIRLSPELTSSLEQFARERQLTLNTLVHGAWALLLSGHSSRDDVLFGSTISGRSAPLDGIETMVGLFINVLPVRVNVPNDSLLIDWLRDLQTAQAESRDYEFTPLVDIHSWCSRSAGTPLFETTVVFENYPVDQALKSDKTRLPLEDIQIIERTNYPLTLLAALVGGRLSLKIMFQTGRLTATQVQHVLHDLERILNQMALAPDSSLELLMTGIGDNPPDRPPATDQKTSNSLQLKQIRRRGIELPSDDPSAS